MEHTASNVPILIAFNYTLIPAIHFMYFHNLSVTLNEYLFLWHPCVGFLDDVTKFASSDTVGGENRLYRWRQKKKLRSWEATSDWYRIPSFGRSRSTQQKKKTNHLARRCIWRYRFQAGVWNLQILKQVVKSQLFISLWNRYYQGLSDIELQN